MGRGAVRPGTLYVLVNLAVLLLILLLAGCGSAETRPARVVETVEVKVPVPVRAEPPGELMAPYVPEALPTWISPADPEATSALSREGEQRLKLLLHDMKTRLDAWRAWALEAVE
jgi:hypothetical protein